MRYVRAAEVQIGWTFLTKSTEPFEVRDKAHGTEAVMFAGGIMGSQHTYFREVPADSEVCVIDEGGDLSTAATVSEPPA